MNEAISALIRYGLVHQLIEKEDCIYVANRLIDVMGYVVFEYVEGETPPLDVILTTLIKDAVLRGVIGQSLDEQELFDTRLMDCLTPRPSIVIKTFKTLYMASPVAATNYFYELSKASHYIKTERVSKNVTWKTKTMYGELDMTINLSKPEKDPKAIALAKALPPSTYPKCLLCKENVGYAGTLNHPARQNHRIIPLQLNDSNWYLQYSPYVYYNEHCIILKDEHEPMKITAETFQTLLAFVSQFKHYFVGSNADLPIVGGSILTHDHFQGGRYTFAMETAPYVLRFSFEGYEDVEAGMLKWPLSVIRLRATSTERLVELADNILKTWRVYDDEAREIKAFTTEPHHTITPIARFKGDKYELDLVLRDNQISLEHPDGIYHPHQQYHHLKKENIGLIEVMGLAVLPPRLVEELEVVKKALLTQNKDVLIEASLQKHLPWVEAIMQAYEIDAVTDIALLIKQEVGLKFVEILACCGVFKQTEDGFDGMALFVEAVNDCIRFKNSI